MKKIGYREAVISRMLVSSLRERNVPELDVLGASIFLTVTLARHLNISLEEVIEAAIELNNDSLVREVFNAPTS
jgi:hypothetical protein